MEITQRSQKSTLALLIIVLALGLRILCVPIHLVHEQHFGSWTHHVEHASSVIEHACSEDDHDHAPHSADDHLVVSVNRRASSETGAFEVPSIAPGTGWCVPLPKLYATDSSFWAVAPPNGETPNVRRPRGPPRTS